MNSIPEIEKKVIIKIDFINKLLSIYSKFIDERLEIPVFKKDEIIKIFKEIGNTCKYLTGGGYLIERNNNKFTFQCDFVISKNSVNIYYLILNDGKFIDSRVTNIGSILRYLPYDEEKLNHNFGLNSLEDLKKFIVDNINLFNEFVDEYIKELENEQISIN
jgi:hypothetical protein